jgi:hypothetical protein
MVRNITWSDGEAIGLGSGKPAQACARIHCEAVDHEDWDSHG